MLSPSDQSRFQGISHPIRRKQFITGRLLSAYAACKAGYRVTPADITLNALNQPCFLPCPTLTLSISHSADYIAVACGNIDAMGIDSEQKNPKRPFIALTHRLFGQASAELLSAMPPAQQIALFYQWWTEKEARFKSRLNNDQPVYVQTWEDQTHSHALVASQKVSTLMTHIPWEDLMK